MLKLSIADTKRIALILKVSQDDVSSVEDIALVSLEALAKPILESDDPEAIDAYNKLKAFIEQQKKEAITNPVLEGFDYGTSPLVSGDIPEMYRKASLLDSPYDSGFYVGMNTDLDEAIGWETYVENMTELPTSKPGITEQDRIEFEKGFTEGRWSRGYGEQIKISKKATVTKKEDGWYVESKAGKSLGGPYKSKEDAEKRLKQVEYWKKQSGRIFKVTETEKIVEIVGVDAEGIIVYDM